MGSLAASINDAAERVLPMQKGKWLIIEAALGLALAGCGASAPGDMATATGGAGGDTDGGATVIDGTAYFPLALGNSWTYQITDAAGNAATRMTTVEAMESVDGTNGTPAFRIRNEALVGATINWELVSGTAAVRYRQNMVDDSNNVLLVKMYAPSSVVFDELVGHLVAGATWKETYMETQSPTNGNAKTSAESVKWTVESLDDMVTVPAGTFPCIRVRRHHMTSMNPADEVTWYAQGIGSVKETGGGPLSDQTRELISANVP